MTKIHDIRNETPKRSSHRKVSSIRKIARHHSATETGDFWSFWNNRWKGLAWITGGYHEIILRDGSVQLCYDADMITNGVLNHNSTTYHICLVGNGSFTTAQEKTFDERAKKAINRFGLSVSDVLGHKEFSGASTACPGTDMNKVRARLKGGSASAKPSSSKPKPSNKGKLTIDGKWGKSTTRALQKALDTPVDGIISKQPRNSVSQSLYGNTVQFGSGGSNVIVALQNKIKVNADGKLGPATVRALQRRLGTPVDGVLSRPSVAVKELQSRLNKVTL